jgi:hypothetical protein
MAISLSDILASLQNGAVAVNGLSKQVKTTFPRRGEFSVTPRSTNWNCYPRRLPGHRVYSRYHEFRICRLCRSISLKLTSCGPVSPDSRRASGRGACAMRLSAFFLRV